MFWNKKKEELKKESTHIIPIDNKEIKEFVHSKENWDLLIRMTRDYKDNKLSNKEQKSEITDINILDIEENEFSSEDIGVKRTTVRVDLEIWKQWELFCNNHKSFSKKDLLSKALKEIIEKYK